MQRSSVQASEGLEKSSDSDTRTSTNTWLARHTDIVIDAIYRWAANVLQISEALLRFRHKFEIPKMTESKIMQGILPTFMGQIGCSVMLQPEQMQLAPQAGASYASPQCFWQIVLYCDNGQPLITG